MHQGKAGKRTSGRSKASTSKRSTTSVRRRAAQPKDEPLTPAAAAAAKKCCVQGCTAPHHARGYCKSHYSQLRRRGTVQEDEAAGVVQCEVAGCHRAVDKNRRCTTHLKDTTPRMTKSERLNELKSRHERMRKEIERIRQSF